MRPPWHYTVKWHGAAAWMVKHGMEADLLVRDRFGDRPLDLARRAGNAELVEILERPTELAAGNRGRYFRNS